MIDNRHSFALNNKLLDHSYLGDFLYIHTYGIKEDDFGSCLESILWVTNSWSKFANRTPSTLEMLWILSRAVEIWSCTRCWVRWVLFRWDYLQPNDMMGKETIKVPLRINWNSIALISYSAKWTICIVDKNMTDLWCDNKLITSYFSTPKNENQGTLHPARSVYWIDMSLTYIDPKFSFSNGYFFQQIWFTTSHMFVKLHMSLVICYVVCHHWRSNRVRFTTSGLFYKDS